MDTITTLFLIGSPSNLLRSSSNLLVTRAGIKSQTSLKPGQIGPVSSEVRALEGRETFP